MCLYGADAPSAEASPRRSRRRRWAAMGVTAERANALATSPRVAGRGPPPGGWRGGDGRGTPNPWRCRPIRRRRERLAVAFFGGNFSCEIYFLTI